ncbi:glycosyltransferase family 4 protein [Pelagicoccus sp. SDUM812003]|uniref:glycosyltransferase family 4 protein n=1 Tax=Pelagicoccus sp. SDUM812003 TaxID=3041267 RepID=UPI00281000C0|nr:glycosyltransferase family 4 protein [Pelagicoccus sp. SDUM812003]MDQ8204662.1 glycosyltransferase family 4 protein [Pelagicoccus sp. SDUM812003]
MPLSTSSRKPRIVVAGQIPPPFGGQNVSIKQLVDDLSLDASVETDRLEFRFTPEFKAVRAVGLNKLLESARVVFRLFKLRVKGPIDLLVYPVGGPQSVPILRDLILLPFILIAARKLVLRFHAAGFANRKLQGDLLSKLAAALYRQASAAIVMTPYNRRDPQSCGIEEIEVLPHQLPDQFSEDHLSRSSEEQRLLYMGHLCLDKGTPYLLEAFAKIAARFPQAHLELAGEPLPPLSIETIQRDLIRLGIQDRVTLLGLVRDEAKSAAFGRANLFVFPSIAPYESYGRVTVEAMMWRLPIVISDWRGNSDVVGREHGGVLYSIDGDMVSNLENALQFALENDGQWSAWGQRNRDRYLAHFGGSSPIVEVLKSYLSSNRVPSRQLALETEN